MDRFACDWHRLADPTPRTTGASGRRNHGPGRTPWDDASPRLVIAEPSPTIPDLADGSLGAAAPTIAAASRPPPTTASGGSPTALQRTLRLGGGGPGGEHVVADHDVGGPDAPALRRPGEATEGRRVHVQSTGQVGGTRCGVEPRLVGQTGPRPEQPLVRRVARRTTRAEATAARVIASVGA